MKIFTISFSRSKKLQNLTPDFTKGRVSDSPEILKLVKTWSSMTH